jgi:hypothetical protein
MLWFGAVHVGRRDDIDLVRHFYQKQLTSPSFSDRLGRWPGPIARFFLNEIDEQSLIEGAGDQHQALCKAHFAVAVRARERRRFGAYRKELEMAAPDQGPGEVYDYYNVLPFFLARHELGRPMR